jgi:hypothetical protein
MKRIKVILGSIAVLAIITVAAFNVSFKLQSKNLSVLSLTNIEILAYGENESNHWTDWLEQGLTKDEYSERKKCTKTTGWSFSLGKWSYNSETAIEGYKTICHDDGYANCTPTDCQ